jgi:hypothetical protein
MRGALGFTIPHVVAPSADFDPTDWGTPVAWWSGRDAGSITASGGDVSQWDTLVGSAHATQATGSLQPKTGVVTLNSHNGLDWTDDLLESSLNADPPAGTWVAVVRPDAISYQAIWASTGSGSSEIRINPSGNLELLKKAVALLATSTGTLAANTPAIVVVTRTDGAGYAFYINGAASGSGTAAGTWSSTETTRIGAYQSTIEHWDGGIFELVRYDAVIADPVGLSDALNDVYAVY